MILLAAAILLNGAFEVSVSPNVVAQMPAFLCSEYYPDRWPEEDCKYFSEAALHEEIVIQSNGKEAWVEGNRVQQKLSLRAAVDLARTQAFLNHQASEVRKELSFEEVQKAFQNVKTKQQLIELKVKTFSELVGGHPTERGGEAFLRKDKEGELFIDLVEIKNPSLLVLSLIVNCKSDLECLIKVQSENEEVFKVIDEYSLISATLSRYKNRKSNQSKETFVKQIEEAVQSVLETEGNSYWADVPSRLNFIIEDNQDGIYLGPWHTHPGITANDDGDRFLSPDDEEIVSTNTRALMIAFIEKTKFEVFDSVVFASPAEKSDQLLSTKSFVIESK